MSDVAIFEAEGFDKQGHILICGWSSQGRRAVDDLGTIAPELEITVVSTTTGDDPNPVPVDDGITHVCGDPTDHDTLLEAGITDASVVVILADRHYSSQPQTLDARTVLTALTVRQLHESVHLIAEVSREDNEDLAADAGVDETIMADRFSGVMLSQALQRPGLSELFTSLFETAAGSVLELRPVPASLVGKPYSHAITDAPSSQLGVVAGLQRDDELMLPPREDIELTESDSLLVMRSV